MSDVIPVKEYKQEVEWMPKSRPVIDERCQQCGEEVGISLYVVEVKHYKVGPITRLLSSTSHEIERVRKHIEYKLCEDCWSAHSNKIKGV